MLNTKKVNEKRELIFDYLQRYFGEFFYDLVEDGVFRGFDAKNGFVLSFNDRYCAYIGYSTKVENITDKVKEFCSNCISFIKGR